jgi:serine/threonine protein kinase
MSSITSQTTKRNFHCEDKAKSLVTNRSQKLDDNSLIRKVQSQIIEPNWSSKAEHSHKMIQKYKIVKVQKLKIGKRQGGSMKHLDSRKLYFNHLDKGSFGEVSLATLIDPLTEKNGATTVTTCTGAGSKKKKEKVFVIKKVDQDKANDLLLSNEIEAGFRLSQHEGIPKFIETYRDSRYCYMIFEYFNGVNMYSYLEERDFKPMKESHVKRLIRQITEALIYCHQNKVCHRDLKLENILYNPKRKEAKLIDFGLCAINPISCADMCNNWCGSPDYVCPEILIQQHYSGCLSDVWSLGVILYVLLYGQMPFNFKERYYALRHQIPHPALEWPNEKNLHIKISESAKDLIKKMLAIDPRERISMEEVPHHKWMIKKSTNFLSLIGLSKDSKSHKIDVIQNNPNLNVTSELQNSLTKSHGIIPSKENGKV